MPRPEEMRLTGEIRRRSLSAEEFVYLRSRTDRLPKVTLPSPGLFANFWSPDDGGPYPDLAVFLDDVTAVLEVEARRLAVSTQCGFGTSVLGNRLTAEEQRRKLSAVVRLARRMWGGAGDSG